MLYRLIEITDKKFVRLTKNEYISRIGRIFDFNDVDIRIGDIAFIKCVNPDKMKSLCLGNVLNMQRTNDGIIIILKDEILFFVEEEKYEKYLKDNAE